MHTVKVYAEPAREAGALDGYTVECTCGLSFGVSLPVLAQHEAAEHRAWHERKAA